MRYLAQFIIPALIFVAVVYLLMRRRRGADPGDGYEGSDQVWFVIILALGAAVALVAAWALVTLLE